MLNGQWTGTYTGANSGHIRLNLDNRGDRYSGVAFLLDRDPKLPNLVAGIQTKDKADEFHIKTAYILPIDPRLGTGVAWDQIKDVYPDVTMATAADVHGIRNEDSLELTWKADTGNKGKATLVRTPLDAPTDYVPLNRTWDEFKAYVLGLKPQNYLFRGQRKGWRLRTHFHRTRRADLGPFRTIDIPTLHRRLSARTRHTYNLEVPNELGAFYSLIQHHGYPTPILDWTYSPYMAAFFAYHRIAPSVAASAENKEERVRVFIFHLQEWLTDYQQYLSLDIDMPHFSHIDFFAFDNERLVAQQATSTVTNVDDIEQYVRGCEASRGKQYLELVDLPMRERPKVMSELSYMGITAGTMFPGLDGACEELKERFFEL